MRTIMLVVAGFCFAGLLAGCQGPGPTPAAPAAPAPAKPAAPKAEMPKPAEPKPAEVKPVEPKPAEPKPVEPKAETPKPAEVKPATPVGGEVVLEVKSFTLKDAEVKDLAGASGGKAVLFDKEDASSATKEVVLKAGKYEAVVYVQAPDADKDAFYLVINGEENRLFPEDYGKVLPTQAAAFEVKKDGAVKVELKASEETGMYLDRVVIKPAK